MVCDPVAKGGPPLSTIALNKTLPPGSRGHPDPKQGRFTAGPVSETRAHHLRGCMHLGGGRPLASQSVREVQV